jgi:predicted 3-demethylubiquinone-9 3-methyltransferase (glyoxalase superfamily)
MLTDPEPGKARKVMEAMLRMRKIDVAELRKARDS